MWIFGNDVVVVFVIVPVVGEVVVVVTVFVVNNVLVSVSGLDCAKLFFVSLNAEKVVAAWFENVTSDVEATTLESSSPNESLLS